MAEAQDPAQASPEPSMEEILASIRKIISDEQDPPTAPASDVIELTQAVQDDGTVEEIKAEEPPPPPPPPEPEPEPVRAVEPPPPPPPPALEEVLISPPAADVAASAMSDLVNAAALERLSSGPQTFTMLGNGSRTLEDLVIEMMRPLLKAWLDTNLPATVERLVQKEIEHISRRSHKD